MIFPQVTHLALSGGGLCGLAYLGCIRFLQTEKLTTGLRHVCGTSIGAFFACLIALDIPYGRLEQIVKEHCKHESLCFDPCDIMNVFVKMGVKDAEFLVISLRKYISEHFNSNDITFLELSKATGKHLVICASCVEMGVPTFFSVDTTPNVGVVDAVKASMSIPVLIKPTKIGDHHYIDGAVTDNHPVTCFGEPLPSSMLSIKVCAKPSVPDNVMSSFPVFLSSVFSTYFSLVDKQYQQTKWHLVLDKSPVGFLPVTFEDNRVKICVSDDDIDKAIAYGYAKLQDWFIAKSAACP